MLGKWQATVRAIGRALQRGTRKMGKGLFDSVAMHPDRSLQPSREHHQEIPGRGLHMISVLGAIPMEGTMTRPAIRALVAALAAITVGCSSGAHTAAEETAISSGQAEPSESAPPVAATPPAVPPATAERRSIDVSRETWNEGQWPLTVDEAVLKCQGDNLVTVVAGGLEYALNAAAFAQTDLPDAEEISIPNPDNSGLHLDVGPLIQRGLALCDAAGAPTASAPPPGGPNRPAGLVERQSWPGRWPFTIDSATLLCQGGAGGARVTVVANGAMYALNGTAKDAQLWPPFDAIWLDDPKFPGAKINIGPMIDHGLSLCD
ncbi:DUF2511 domain-containing protein [Mycolicibacterium sp. CR10]|uniref:DUF2511 domain-containing protein n=1 Tax=Mycolicibacterium sp. CR10 TaxID=2562314 RepID=UPI001485A7B9|nr:DUF2511 domain-containing protein [Mycolicibacterium sp. CR10]